MGKLRSQGLVVHEWGTFTSVQGGEGVPLSWKPLETSRLPNFVYDWRHAGLGRISTSMLSLFLKGDVTTLQRMETPVIYFYSDTEQTVDMSVQFPGGLITEWFPQAGEIGPSRVESQPNAILALDNEISNVKESIIRWSQLQILPTRTHPEISQALAADASGSHYFAARDTDAAYVRQDSLSTTNPSPEHEKFLFYRGIGSFATPLRVTMKSDDDVTVANTGKEILSHLFVLGVKDKAGNFVYLDRLQPGEEKTIPASTRKNPLPLPVVAGQISKEMAAALVKEGLYAREATAMVNTWKDSWFQEEGVRVLYVLPKSWTDQTLPMNINPAPTELVRVMVGRAEVLAPGIEEELALQMDKAKQGDTKATLRTHQILTSLGRFAETAFSRALVKAKPQPKEQGKLMALLSDVRNSK
ncbi:MAG: hypothetical protein JWR26_452 [Pedosphaera sp.]|nr:hypothetical protein [Pedosphaera sp.]